MLWFLHVARKFLQTMHQNRLRRRSFNFFLSCHLFGLLVPCAATHLRRECRCNTSLITQLCNSASFHLNNPWIDARILQLFSGNSTENYSGRIAIHSKFATSYNNCEICSKVSIILRNLMAYILMLECYVNILLCLVLF